MLKKNATLKKLLSFKKRALKYARIIRYRILVKHNTHKRITVIKNKLWQIKVAIAHSCKLCHYRPFWLQAAFAKTTFLLCVRPKNKVFPFLGFAKKNTFVKNTPPPGYGVPPGYENTIEEHSYQTKEEYGLYLSPGRINIAIIFLTFTLSLFVCAPFINEYYPSNPSDSSHLTYPLILVIYWLIAGVSYHLLFNKMMPASLTQVWEKWPIHAYDLFLSVPHKITISRYDRLTKIQKENKDLLECYQTPKQYIFWRPDKKNPMWQQSTERAPDMRTLQDLILNLAVFEFLFHKNDMPKNKKKDETSLEILQPSEESLREYHWYFFLFSPIIINLALILLSIFVFSLLNGEDIDDLANPDKNFRLITHFPYNFVIAVLLWFLYTIYYVHWILSTLTDLSQKIHQGYFNAQLDMIPQQILNELSYIPTQEQVDRGIAYVKNILSWSSGIVLLGLMAVFEIFSQPLGRLHIDYGLWETLTRFLPFN